MMETETLPSLPDGWVWTKLVVSCKYLPTGIENFKGRIEYYSTGSIQDSHYIPEGIFSFSERPSRSNRMAQKGDLRKRERGLLRRWDDNNNKKRRGTG